MQKFVKKIIKEIKEIAINSRKILSIDTDSEELRRSTVYAQYNWIEEEVLLKMEKMTSEEREIVHFQLSQLKNIIADRVSISMIKQSDRLKELIKSMDMKQAAKGENEIKKDSFEKIVGEIRKIAECLDLDEALSGKSKPSKLRMIDDVELFSLEKKIFSLTSELSIEQSMFLFFAIIALHGLKDIHYSIGFRSFTEEEHKRMTNPVYTKLIPKRVAF